MLGGSEIPGECPNCKNPPIMHSSRNTDGGFRIPHKEFEDYYFQIKRLNIEIAQGWMNEINESSHPNIPNVGDFILTHDGNYHRVSVVNNKYIQYTPAGSFNLHHGHVSFSGGCGDVAQLDKIKPLRRLRNGRFWMFDRGVCRAYNSVGRMIDLDIDFMVEFRVFGLIE